MERAGSFGQGRRWRKEGVFMELCDDLQVFGAYHSVVFERKSSRAVLFGGQCCVNGPYEYFRGVHTLQFQEDDDDDDEGWSPLPTEGPHPCPRAQHSAAIRGCVMVIYGGANDVRQFNDVWLLDLSDCTWTEMRPDERHSEPAPPVETRIEQQNFRVKSCRSILSLRGMQLLVLGRSRKPVTGRWALYAFDLHTACWKALPAQQLALWRGNAAGWVTKLDDGKEELWVHGGHREPGSREAEQLVLPLHTGPTALLQRTIRGIHALPPENLKLVFSYLSGHLLDLL
ncbi:unnamed protein product [Symbiodinium natans]|uniref:Uncharacterized protein n=1 Tax=Symbiodinium natans TaxID=878477 RepID=A0A812Q178_9DINO|nr:unnamed protein product [Symbiodinium natans]